LNTNSNKSYKIIQPQVDVASPLSLQRTRWLFLVLCCYLLSQSFTIPIIAIGPSWTLWPTLSDFATGLLVLAFFLNFRHASPASSANTKLFWLLILVFLGSLLSYTAYLSSVLDDSAPGINWGFYHIYRLVEFIFIFWVTAKIPLTPKRINTLRWSVDFVLVLVCLSIILTFYSIVPLQALTAHLPENLTLAGPWGDYARLGRLGIKAGWGTLGYNHSYVAAQVLLILSLRIHLRHGKQEPYDNILVLISIFACFLSEARAGLAGILFFAMMFWFKKPIYAVITVLAASMVSLPVMIITSANRNFNNSDTTSVIERQKTLLEADNSENLAGRAQIWIDRVAFLDEEPVRWLVGTGFGSSTDSGAAAHMLPLHIIIETGIVGLLLFVFLFYHILYFLYQHESGFKSVFWATIALLFASITQETFYPVPALLHFLGFYLCSVAIALRSSVYEKESQQLALN